jgi:hypothetical protein
MTTPTTPDEPDETPTTEHPAADYPAAEAAPLPPPPQPPSQAYAPQPPPYAPQPYPFVPKVREPWINPAKRGAFGLIAAVLAIVLLGGGFVVGAAAAHRHDRGGHSQQMRQFQGQPDGQPGVRAPQGRFQPGGVVPGNGRFRGPGQRPGQTVPTASPTPVPSTSHS